jgi:hypothetical protein
MIFFLYFIYWLLNNVGSLLEDHRKIVIYLDGLPLMFPVVLIVMRWYN